MSTYTIIIELDKVGEGDVTDLAERVWNEHAIDLDASRGDFRLRILKDGFAFDWEPTS